MRVEICYCHPTVPGDHWINYGLRFIETYLRNPPLAIHDTVIICNGGPQTSDIEDLFKVLPGVKFFRHDNSGYELGAYQAYCQTCTADMIVFFAASTYFRRPSWLNRMVQTFKGRGPGIYGAMGNRGHPPMHAYNRVYPHLRTTAFWMPPSLFNAYPTKITDPGQRYEMEHGASCLTGWVTRQGLGAWVITFDGEYGWEQWDADPQGFHQGTQNALLVGDRLCEPPYFPHP